MRATPVCHQVHPQHRAASRPHPRPAHQARGQDRNWHLPSRQRRQGAERGQGAGRRPWRARQGGQEDYAERAARRQGAHSAGTFSGAEGMRVDGVKRWLEDAAAGSIA